MIRSTFLNRIIEQPVITQCHIIKGRMTTECWLRGNAWNGSGVLDTLRTLQWYRRFSEGPTFQFNVQGDSANAWILKMGTIGYHRNVAKYLPNLRPVKKPDELTFRLYRGGKLKLWHSFVCSGPPNDILHCQATSYFQARVS